MNLKKTGLHILHGTDKLSTKARKGVSLHCHTEHSKESLDFLPHYGEKLPIISFFWKKERAKYREKKGKDIDFSTAYWSPPLTAHSVFQSEKTQINESGLEAIVSLTDHDCIDGALQVSERDENDRPPISFEWTVPYEFAFFHVGVHNLPKDRAIELTSTLLDYTFNEENHSHERLAQMFAMLSEMPGVLVVLNHPLWDIEMVGAERHEMLLKSFVKEHGRWIHAFEINGFRSWSENKAILEMAEALGIPVVSGGDRHGCKPNTVINLTNGESFEEFAEEVRVKKRSEVVLMPAYKQPLLSRQLQSFSEILKHYPEFCDGRQIWFERFYFDIGDGKGQVRLSDQGWKPAEPVWLRWTIWTLSFLGGPRIRPAFGLARKRKDRVPKSVANAKFEKVDMEEISAEWSTGMV